jgi:hypothetical protein
LFFSFFFKDNFRDFENEGPPPNLSDFVDEEDNRGSLIYPDYAGKQWPNQFVSYSFSHF